VTGRGKCDAVGLTLRGIGAGQDADNFAPKHQNFAPKRREWQRESVFVITFRRSVIVIRSTTIESREIQYWMHSVAQMREESSQGGGNGGGGGSSQEGSGRAQGGSSAQDAGLLGNSAIKSNLAPNARSPVPSLPLTHAPSLSPSSLNPPLSSSLPACL